MMDFRNEVTDVTSNSPLIGTDESVTTRLNGHLGFNWEPG